MYMEDRQKKKKKKPNNVYLMSLDPRENQAEEVLRELSRTA